MKTPLFSESLNLTQKSEWKEKVKVQADCLRQEIGKVWILCVAEECDWSKSQTEQIHRLSEWLSNGSLGKLYLLS